VAERSEVLPGFSPVGGKPVHVSFDAGRPTSDAGIVLLGEIECKSARNASPAPAALNTLICRAIFCC
jgi:hypothetical protein